MEFCPGYTYNPPVTSLKTNSTNVFSYFFTYNYTGSAFTDTSSISSYTLPFTPLTFVPNLSDNQEFYSNKRIIWDFGDGTYSESITAVHYFKEVGVYNVTNYLFDKNGNSYSNSFVQPVTIKNFITDNILVSSYNLTAHSLTAGKLVSPLKITNGISWQGLSGNPENNIPIITYISGGRSLDYFRDGIANIHYGHLYPYSSTFLLLTSQGGVTEFVEMSSFTTDSTPIYTKLSGSAIIQTDKFDRDGFFCGLTGVKDVYYRDDLSARNVNLFFGYQPNTLRPYSNTSTVGVKVSVVSNKDLNRLSISSNGIDGEGQASSTFNISKIKFSNSKIPFTIKVKDSQNFTIKDLPKLDNMNLALTNGSTTYTNAVFTQVSALSGISRGGFYQGYFTVDLPSTTENVYISANTTVNSVFLSGQSNTFTIYPSSGIYKVAKYGENIDFESKFKEISFQPLFLNKKILFNDFLGTIFGNLSSAQTTIGKTTYEKIENFVDNNCILDYSNISQLISLLRQANIDLERFSSYNFNFPTEIGRLVNILSINHSRLFGTQNVFSNNFNSRGYLDSSVYGKNLGNEITLHYNITAGSDIVAFEKFSGLYKRLNTYLPLCAAGISLTNGNEYKLSSYSDNWGWGLILPSDGYGLNLSNFYLFYEYNPGIDGTITEGIINFNDLNTTLSFTNSSFNEWSSKDGIISNLVTKQLYNGLNLFL